MPPPWSPKIYIDKDKYLKGTLLGEETTLNESFTRMQKIAGIIK